MEISHDSSIRVGAIWIVMHARVRAKVRPIRAPRTVGPRIEPCGGAHQGS